MTTSHRSVFGSRVAVAIAASIVTAVVVAGGIAVASVPDDSVTSAKIVDRTIRGVDISDGAVGARNLVPNQRAGATAGRLAFAEQTVPNIGDEQFLDVAPVTLAVPASGGGGAIQVTATVEAEVTTGEPPCEISAGLVQTGGLSGGDQAIRVNVVQTGVGENDEETGTILDVIPVAGGAQVQIHLSTRVDNSPSCDTQVVNATYALSALYVPFDGAGG